MTRQCFEIPRVYRFSSDRHIEKTVIFVIFHNMPSKNTSDIIVSITLSADEYLKRYQGMARSVYTKTLDGRSVRFPAGILQPYVTHNGISGVFSHPL